MTGPVILLAAVSLATTPGLAASRLDEGRAFHAAGQWDRALAAYAEVAETLAESDPASAATARNNACVIWMNKGDHRTALEECEQALELRQRVDDPLRLGRTLNNLGLALQYLGRYDEATLRFEEAREVNREILDPRGEMINTTNLGMTAIQAGRYSAALDRVAEAFELASRHPDEAWVPEQVRLARINQGVVYERLGAFRLALDTYKQVLEEGDALRERDRASLQVNLGVVYRNLGDPVAAIDAFEDAVRIYERVGDRAALSNAHLNIGLALHENLARPHDAEPELRRALELARASGDATEELQDLTYLGHLLIELDRLDEARELLQEALDRTVGGGTRVGRWSALAGLAEIAGRRGDLHDAVERFGWAMDEIEEVRSSLETDTLRSQYFGDKRAVYVAAVETLARLHRTEPDRGHDHHALDLVQRAKARSLLDALGPETRGLQPSKTADIVDRVGDETLLEYFAGDENLFVWVVGRGRVRWVALGPPATVLADVKAVHAALSGHQEPDAEALRRLSTTLLEPVTELTGVRAVTIAPSGALHYLPFELLATSAGDRLIDVATVRYLPSGSALGRAAPSAGGRRLRLLGFGNPLLDQADAPDRPTPASLLVTRFSLGALPGAAEELASLTRWLPEPYEVRIGDAATEETFREWTAQGADVVHLSSHTVVDEGRGGGAAILLSPGATSDGLLTPQEIAALDYHAALTVLAACRTSFVGASSGDALTSVTGAFLAAGSEAVVATLWDVEDDATRVFMDQFYFQLSRGLPAADALRQAKLRLIADPEWNRSSVWAAFVLVGQTGPIVPGRPIWLRLLIPAAVLLAGGYWLISTRLASIRRPKVST